MKAMMQVGNVEWDIASLAMGELTADNQSYFRDLGESCEQLPNVTKAGVNEACQQYGVIFDLGTQPLAYDRSAFPGATRLPSSWADFWDVGNFPGPRSLPNIGQPEHPLIAALLADGVPGDKLFPLDLDRAFRKLDEIRPHVTVWWGSGDQSVQMFRTKEVVMALMYSNRARSLQAEGLPIEISWEGAILDAYIWTILARAPRPLAALALLNFIYTRPEAHAAYSSELRSAATGMKDAAKYMKPADAAKLPTNEKIWPHIIKMDLEWLGKNKATMNQRWTEWIAQ
ncbi:extracellular solute-binding protein [Sinorhizobium meliloti]|uniref:extracellular solute-binding protein n=1 Tax=Rhizobium meliloti TaxID=382 RepID=UPI00398C8483